MCGSWSTTSVYGTNSFCYLYITSCLSTSNNCSFVLHSTFRRQWACLTWSDSFGFFHTFTFDGVSVNDGSATSWWRRTWCLRVHTGHAGFVFGHSTPCRCLTYIITKAGWRAIGHSYTCWRKCSALHFLYFGISFSNLSTKFVLRAITTHDEAIFKGFTTRFTTVTRSSLCCMTYVLTWSSFVCNNGSGQTRHVNDNDGCTARHLACSSTRDFIFAVRQTVSSHGLQCSVQHIWQSTHRHVLQSHWAQVDIRSKVTFYWTTQRREDWRSGRTTYLTLRSFHFTSLYFTKVWGSLHVSSFIFFCWSHRHLQTTLYCYTTCLSHATKCGLRRCGNTHSHSLTYSSYTRPWQRAGVSFCYVWCFLHLTWTRFVSVTSGESVFSSRRCSFSCSTVCFVSYTVIDWSSRSVLQTVFIGWDSSLSTCS